MDKTQEALKLAIKALNNANKTSITFNAYDKVIEFCEEALETKQERNFCSRCGKRASKDLNHIHTCTPPNN